MEALPAMNHHFLQEFCLKDDGYEYEYLLNPLNGNTEKYLEKCSDLKVVKLEFKPSESKDGNGIEFLYPSLDVIASHIVRFRLKNLQEFHLIGVRIHDDFEMVLFDQEEEVLDFENFLDTIAENFPKLQRLCLTCNKYDSYYWRETCQAFASRRNIKVEVEVSKNYQAYYYY